MGDKKRRSSLLRRSLGVKKKAAEFAVLCDASLCLIHFDQDGQLSTFPEDASEVDNILKRYLHADGPNMPEKRKVSGLSSTFQGGGGDSDGDGDGDGGVHAEGRSSRHKIMAGDEYLLLDTKSAPELVDLGRDLDAKMKQLEERIKLLKGTRTTTPAPEDDQKQKTTTFGSSTSSRSSSSTSNDHLQRFYRDGTPFSPGDLQLMVISCNEIPAAGSSTDQTTSPPDQHDSTRLDANNNNNNNVMTTGKAGDHFICSSTAGSCRCTNICSSCDSNVGGVVKKQQKLATPVDQLFYRDGTPVCPDDLRMNIN